MKLNLVALIAISLTLSAAIAEARPRNENRQHRQGARIRQGVASGELTKKEAKSLQNQQQHIEKKIDRLEEGGLTDAEKVRVEKMQDRASRRIHRLKHNDRNAQPGAGAGSGAGAPAPEAPAAEVPASE
jgi:hypothetical protein